MIKPRLVTLLLSTAILAPTSAWAQDSTSAPASGAVGADPASSTAEPAAEEAAPDVSIPGGAIIVTGQRNRNIERVAPQVVSVLSTEQIARTGEGDIAGALGRVTGLSVVGNGYVYVRGLGDRYSLALLNGSPLPSPEPLKRVVPLDLFPTSIIASSLVQKSYSTNFPGEFGGGVINLTTKSIPEESFLTIGGGIGWDTESTNKLGYTYYGAKSDWTGYDNGNRSIPPALKSYLNGNTVMGSNSDQAKEIGSVLFRGRNAVVQRIDKMQPNFSVDLSAGTKFEMGEVTLGVIGAAGYSNKTQTRDAIQQLTQGLSANPNNLWEDYRTVSTDNRIVVNGMLGMGLEWGENSIRWTNVYIHDTSKFTRLRAGNQESNPAVDFISQKTAWYERALLDTQLTGEFKVDDKTTIDLRGGFANSKRLSPFEIDSEYIRTNDGTQFGQNYVNTLGTGAVDPTTITFSRLSEDVWSAGADVSHQFFDGWRGTVGYAYQLNRRTNTNRQFGVYASGDQNLIQSFGLLRPDVLLQPGMWYINQAGGVNYNLELRDLTANVGLFDARLLNHAFYGKVDGQITDSLSVDAGVRWEYAKQSTVLRPVGAPAEATTDLKKEYFLPALTLTYEIEPSMQVRVNGSKTIARPQFRELVYQNFYDPDSNRTYRGNPFLKDSQLYNAEARFEWYFGRDERVSLGGFYKHIKNPIESILAGSESFITTYANAPAADLYGAELEVQKHVYLDTLGGSFFENRRLVLVGNYTYTKSKLKVGDDDTTDIYGASTTQFARDYFRNGAPLTGQAEHLLNLQLGMEDTEKLSQQTILLSYASKRSVSRGLVGTVRQPDVIEYPGLRIDVVLRQGIQVGGKEIELKAEGRNLTGRKHLEYQTFEDGRVDFNTYDLGRVFSLSATAKF
ncbi:MAG: TonB-dependent receptor [Novosphingobium lindaniclasticum]|jgi:outer membrane receptor protein involved in Fe transport|uniref:TonB-dependent receptor domain-containing protein n=1 Tax=Novosphingobium lindaniclasticum TaxID=1329895 RepID=UPI002409F2A6|nr:TonB-dependent receptor [Novosphingobium lindaniclasticum]MDF2637251.1 TonB-dependent receptor [Novosphingobium lindaniclasticum]